MVGIDFSITNEDLSRTVYVLVSTNQRNRSNIIEFRDISKTLEGMPLPKDQENTREPDPRNGSVRVG